MRSRRGTAMIEYALLTALAAVSLMSMAGYIRNGISGRWRESADSIGEQYDPRRTTGTLRTHVFTDTGTDTSLKRQSNPVGGGTAVVVNTRTRIIEDKNTRTGDETVQPGGKLWN